MHSDQRRARGSWLAGVSLAAALALGSTTSAFAAGTLNFAITDEPPHLDVHVTTATLTSIVDMHVLETLYTFNSAQEPVPLLAESETVSDDGKTITIKLREGVPFHNGQEMMAEDVVASLKRWGEHGGRGKVLFDHIESVEATGDHEVTITFSDVFGPWKNLLAFNNGGPAILPASIVSDQGADPLAPEKIIGTGPFQFNEWRPNRYLEVTRFEDYAQPPGEPDGYAGQRTGDLDAIRFIAVPDVGTRVSGVQAGDYDYAERIPGDLFNDLDADDSVQTVRHGASQMPLLFFNSAGGIFKDNYKLRQAIMAALDEAEALAIAVGPDDLWAPRNAIYEPGTPWSTESSDEAAAAADLEKAKQLAEEAGYNGEPIRFMVSSSYPLHYDTGQVFDQQLQEAGFNIDFQVYDWPTLVERRADPELWDIFETTHGAMPDPVLYTFMNDNYPGWWVSPEKEELENRFTSTTDPEERQQIWAEIQELMFEQVPVIKPGDVYLFDIASPALQGIDDQMDLFWPVFWNVSKEG